MLVNREHGVNRLRVGMMAAAVVGIVFVAAAVAQCYVLTHILLRDLTQLMMLWHRLKMCSWHALRMLMLCTCQMRWRAWRRIRVKMASKRCLLLLLVDLKGMGHCRVP